MEYSRYLQSEDWKNKRLQKHERKGGAKSRCSICADSKLLDVHHLSYKTDLSEVEQKDLRVLCRRCHTLTHKLFKEGKIKFKSLNHHSRFASIKFAVKKELGISNQNLFKKNTF